MRVCVLTDEEPGDFDPGPFLRHYAWEMVTMRAPVSDTLRSIACQGRFDVYLNLCEGHEPDPDSAPAYDGVDVVRALEQLDLPFTGADSAFFDPTRERMQAVAETNGIPFASGYRVASVEQAVRLCTTLRFPLIVKHPQGYASTGVTRESRVETVAELTEQVARACAAFGAARMERFIPGREFTVLVVDDPDDPRRPTVYSPAELIFPAGEEFWHTDLKWGDCTSFAFAEVTEPRLSARLQDIASRFFLAMNGAGYARCDIRMNDEGALFLLEINPNPAIMFSPEELGPADHIILFDRGGYDRFFEMVFRHACLRHANRARTGRTWRDTSGHPD